DQRAAIDGVAHRWRPLLLLSEDLCCARDQDYRGGPQRQSYSGCHSKPPYSIFNSSFLINSAHLASSRSRSFACSSGVEAIGSAASAAMRCFTSSELSAARNSLLRRSTMAG